MSRYEEKQKYMKKVLSFALSCSKEELDNVTDDPDAFVLASGSLNVVGSNKSFIGASYQDFGYDSSSDNYNFTFALANESMKWDYTGIHVKSVWLGVLSKASDIQVLRAM